MIRTMRQNIKTIQTAGALLFSCYFLFSCCFVPVVLAQTTANTVDEYTLLSPLPGTTNTEGCTGSTCKTSLEKYLPGIFNLSIAVGAGAAFVVLTIYGF